MMSLTIALSDDGATELRKRAAELKVSPEEFVSAMIEDILTRSDEDFEQAVQYVLRKNAELYQRLA